MVAWILEVGVLGLALAFWGAEPAMAAAKAQTQEPASSVSGSGCQTGGNSSLAKPIRRVILRPVATKTFPLPNGGSVDLSQELNTMMMTAVAGTEVFAPMEMNHPDQSESDPCQQHVEIRATLTTLEMNLIEAGITIGYSPTKVSTGITNVNGTVNAKIGLIAFDFSLWECHAGRCTAITANSASHKTSKVDLNLQLDFNMIRTGTQLVYNSSLGNTLRKIITDGITGIASSPRVNDLPWYAMVREYVPGAGILFFDAGFQSRLKPNQNFTIYAATEATGFCGVYKPVAYAHTTQVDAVSSTALVDRILDSRPVTEGDVVMIRMASGSN